MADDTLIGGDLVVGQAIAMAAQAFYFSVHAGNLAKLAL